MHWSIRVPKMKKWLDNLTVIHELRKRAACRLQSILTLNFGAAVYFLERAKLWIWNLKCRLIFAVASQLTMNTQGHINTLHKFWLPSVLGMDTANFCHPYCCHTGISCCSHGHTWKGTSFRSSYCVAVFSGLAFKHTLLSDVMNCHSVCDYRFCIAC